MPSYLKTKVEETKQFVKEHQAATFVGTAITSLIICKGVHMTSEYYWRGMYNSLINSDRRLDMEHLTLLKFIESKNLRREFERFNIKQNNL